MRKLYEEQLGDVLWEVENARTRTTYKRVVVKSRKPKKHRKNGKVMLWKSKREGFNRAATKFMRDHAPKNVKPSSITVSEIMQIEENAIKRALATRGQQRKLAHTDNLVGLDIGLLRVWKQSDSGGQYWCLCACGGYCEVSSGHLLNGRKKDCGHRRRDKRRQQNHRVRQRLATMLTVNGTPRKRRPHKKHRLALDY